ncbi:MAG: hypothetical protein Q7K98_07675 [Candidatus Omnitrophota bacterium]|nr:hypothetical protein [Candidatus Omnitrophota bacterium]
MLAYVTIFVKDFISVYFKRMPKDITGWNISTQDAQKYGAAERILCIQVEYKFKAAF